MQKTIKKNITLDLDYKDDFDIIDKTPIDDVFLDSEFFFLNGKSKLSKMNS